MPSKKHRRAQLGVEVRDNKLDNSRAVVPVATTSGQDISGLCRIYCLCFYSTQLKYLFSIQTSA
jgi:hypothetical protein